MKVQWQHIFCFPTIPARFVLQCVLIGRLICLCWSWCFTFDNICPLSIFVKYFMPISQSSTFKFWKPKCSQMLTFFDEDNFSVCVQFAVHKPNSSVFSFHQDNFVNYVKKITFWAPPYIFHTYKHNCDVLSSILAINLNNLEVYSDYYERPSLIHNN